MSCSTLHARKQTHKETLDPSWVLPATVFALSTTAWYFLQGAARSSSPAGLCLSLAEKGFVALCVSDAILDEVGEVLRRPKVRAKFPTLTDERVSQFLETVRCFSTFFGDVTRELPLARDPKDEPYINLARTAQAQYLVSRDTDLLAVPTASDRDSRRIREDCPSLQIVDPITFLGLLQQASKYYKLTLDASVLIQK